MFGYLIGGRPRPWPEGMEGQNIVAYASGALFIIAGILILIDRKNTISLIAVAAYILLFAALPTLYNVISTLRYDGVLTNLGKSLTFGSAALLVAKSYRGDTYSNSLDNKIISMGSLCQYLTGFFFLASGIQHFLFADFVKFLIPSFIPGALFWTYFAGVALIATGLGLITGIKAQLAATLAGWMVFIWVFALHIPLALKNPSQNEWTAVFEATGVSGILFLISANLNRK
jgi:uncharacterized membrane protein